MLKQLLVSVVLIVTFAMIPSVSLAYTSKICEGTTTCTEKEVGPFMQGISKECGNSGTCQLVDLMLVITNTGNYVLGLIGAVVLLMYTVGGLNYLLGGAMPSRIQKGKDMMKYATIGLFIVFFAYLGVNTLVSVIKSGDISNPGDIQKCIDGHDGEECGDNMVCSKGSCLSLCEIAQTQSEEPRQCTSFDPADEQAQRLGCIAGQCPGGQYCCFTNEEDAQLESDLNTY